jgi:hypothetical protein
VKKALPLAVSLTFTGAAAVEFGSPLESRTWTASRTGVPAGTLMASGVPSLSVSRLRKWDGAATPPGHK